MTLEHEGDRERGTAQLLKEASPRLLLRKRACLRVAKGRRACREADEGDQNRQWILKEV